jgi:hypothetical protein
MRTKLGLALAAVVMTGCEGQVILPSGGVDLITKADDDKLRTMDPTLFDIANKYFPGETALAPPTRIFRLTRRQMDLTAASLLPANATADSAMATLPRDALVTNYEYAENLAFDSANFTPYTKWVDQMVTSVRANPKSVIDCSASNNAPSCLQTEARKFLVKGFRGSASEADLLKHINFYVANVAAVGIADATADLVELALSSRNFAFRDEVSTDGSNVMLPAQRLQALSYALTNAPPEAVGLSSANPAQSLGDVDSLVDRLVASPQAREKLGQFFTAWLDLRDPTEFTLAPTAYPEFTPAVAAAAVDDTKRFINFHVAKPAPKLKDLTQATQAFVSQPLVSIYGLKQSNPNGSGLVDLDPTQRLGLFTQPAVIASHSGPTTTRLTKRGAFFTRKVMCVTLGAIPNDIKTDIPMVPGVSERHRIETATAGQARCLGCHTYINPFGFVQENYDATGKWRDTDQGQPIDPSISISFLDEGAFTTRSPVEAMKTFTSSAKFKQCFVRQFFRYYMGREETPSDDPLLRKMFFNFAKDDDQDLTGLLRVLATSSTFSQRVAK